MVQIGANPNIDIRANVDAQPAVNPPQRRCRCYKSVVDPIFATLGQVRSNTGMLVKSFKIVVAVMTGIGAFVVSKALGTATGKFSSITDIMDTSSDVMSNLDSLVARRIVRDADGAPKLNERGEVRRSTAFVRAWKKEPAKAIFNTGMIAATVGGVALLLDDLKAISLKAIADKITQKIPAFARVAKVGLGTIVNGIVAASFAFLGIDAIIRLAKGGNTQSKVSAALDLAWSVAEIALKVFLVIGGVALIGGTAGVLVGVALAVLASAVGIAGSIYKIVKERNDRAAAAAAA